MSKSLFLHKNDKWIPLSDLTTKQKEKLDKWWQVRAKNNDKVISLESMILDLAKAIGYSILVRFDDESMPIQTSIPEAGCQMTVSRCYQTTLKTYCYDEILPETYSPELFQFFGKET